MPCVSAPTFSSMICRNFATPWKVSCRAMSATMKAPWSPRKVFVARLPSFFSETCMRRAKKRDSCFLDCTAVRSPSPALCPITTSSPRGKPEQTLRAGWSFSAHRDRIHLRVAPRAAATIASYRSEEPPERSSPIKQCALPPPPQRKQIEILALFERWMQR